MSLKTLRSTDLHLHKASGTGHVVSLPRVCWCLLLTLDVLPKATYVQLVFLHGDFNFKTVTPLFSSLSIHFDSLPVLCPAFPSTFIVLHFVYYAMHTSAFLWEV